MSVLDDLFAAEPARPGYYSAPWYADLLACTRCSCRQEAKQVVGGEGPPNATIIFLGQNPGDEEDAQGRPFCGRAGDELDTWFTELRLDRDKVLITNALKCHTTGNRPPKKSELSVCLGWLYQEIEFFARAQVIVPLGKPAAQVLLADTKIPSGFTCSWVWLKYVDGASDRRLLVVPLPHPAYLLRVQGRKPEMRVLLEQVREVLEREVPEAYAAAKRD